MELSEKIAFLNKYTLSSEKKVEFITDESTILNAPIPEYWKKAFVVNDIKERKSIIFSEWKKYEAQELRNTILYLQTYSTNIELMKIGNEYSVLYTILGFKTKREFFYEGKNPVTEQAFKEKIKCPIEKIDNSIIDFYTKIHNGFYDFTSKSMGLDALNVIDPVSDFEWEYEDQLDMDLTFCYNFFSNGMGTYVVLDLNQDMETGAYLWSTKELPKGNLNFWDIIDEWIIIGLDFQVFELKLNDQTKQPDYLCQVVFENYEGLTNTGTGQRESNEQLAKLSKGVKDATRQDLTNQFVESSFNGNLIKEYVKDVKLNTNRNIPNNQIEELKNTLRLREYEKISPVEVAKHRAEFNRLKNSLIDEWELKTGQTWPTYSEDVIGTNGNVVRKAGSKYDAHHIIENSYGGNNEWWNIHPARFPNEHQAGIHRAGSPARELFN